MRRTLIVLVAGLLTAALAASAALASSVHFKKPLPTFSKGSNFALTASGINLTGLGNGDLRIVIQATGTGSAQCQNPGGSSKVPGQNPVAVNVSGSVDVPASALVNGNVLDLSVSTVAPAQPTPTEAGCPTDKWTVVAFTVTYTSATLTVFQDSNGQNGVFDAPGTQVLQQTFQFSPAL
jgi:hypothetical protein